MYFKALTQGLVNIPNIPIKFRNKIRSLNKNLGSRKFYTKLLKLDPLVKNQINIHDTHRAIRAYEVKLYTKKSIYNILLTKDSNLSLWFDLSLFYNM